MLRLAFAVLTMVWLMPDASARYFGRSGFHGHGFHHGGFRGHGFYGGGFRHAGFYGAGFGGRGFSGGYYGDRGYPSYGGFYGGYRRYPVYGGYGRYPVYGTYGAYPYSSGYGGYRVYTIDPFNRGGQRAGRVRAGDPARLGFTPR